MTFTKIAFLVALSSSTMLAEDTIKLFSSEYSDTRILTKTSFAISSERFFQIPIWNPLNSTAPTDLNAAITNANRFVVAHYETSPEKANFKPASISLQQQNGRWWYVFWFHSMARPPIRDQPVVVLMDGTVVVPQITTEPASIPSR